jgi:hypothetical protein
LKQRFWAFVIGFAFIAIIIIVIAAQQPSTANRKLSQTVSVTVLNNIGVDQIEIRNLNTGKTFIATLLSLPLQFNVTRGDYLQFRVITHEGYRWNAWWFSPIDVYNNDNPAIISASGTIVVNNEILMLPNCLIISQTNPTPTPTEVPLE